MVNKNKSNDLYSIWYNISTEVGKKILDMSKIENLDYGSYQKNWEGYTEKLNDQFSKLMALDENYYKNMVTLWNEFTESMNSQITSLNVYDKTNYSQWYESWLEYTDKVSKDFTQMIKNNLKQQSELNEMNELWHNKFRLTEEHTKRIMEMYQIMSDYWQDVMDKSTDIFKESMDSKNNLDFAGRFSKFYKYWFGSYSNMVDQLINTSTPKQRIEEDSEAPFLGLKMLKELYKNNIKNFEVFQQFNVAYYQQQLQELKSDVDAISDHLDNYKTKSSSRKKR